MAKPVDKGIKISFELVQDGTYITIDSKQTGVSEYMGMPYDIPYLISVLNIMLDRSVHLSGEDIKVL